MNMGDKEFERFLDENSPNDMKEFMLKAMRQKVILLKDMILVSSECYCKIPEESKIRENFEFFIIQLMNMGLEAFKDFDLFIGSDDDNYEGEDGGDTEG